MANRRRVIDYPVERQRDSRTDRQTVGRDKGIVIMSIMHSAIHKTTIYNDPTGIPFEIQLTLSGNDKKLYCIVLRGVMIINL